MWTLTRYGKTFAQVQRESMVAFGLHYLPDSLRVQSPKPTRYETMLARQEEARASRTACQKAQIAAICNLPQIADRVNFLASNPGWIETVCPEYQIFADLDGTHAAQFLRNAGFEVVANGDNGRFGFARTACGIMLSTNGHIWRVEA